MQSTVLNHEELHLYLCNYFAMHGGATANKNGFFIVDTADVFAEELEVNTAGHCIVYKPKNGLFISITSKIGRYKMSIQAMFLNLSKNCAQRFNALARLLPPKEKPSFSNWPKGVSELLAKGFKKRNANFFEIACFAFIPNGCTLDALASIANDAKYTHLGTIADFKKSIALTEKGKKRYVFKQHIFDVQYIDAANFPKREIFYFGISRGTVLCIKAQQSGDVWIFSPRDPELEQIVGKTIVNKLLPTLKQ